jgi:hypothetical protein
LRRFYAISYPKITDYIANIIKKYQKWI